jgi:hypothetical protein
MLGILGLSLVPGPFKRRLKTCILLRFVPNAKLRVLWPQISPGEPLRGTIFGNPSCLWQSFLSGVSIMGVRIMIGDPKGLANHGPLVDTLIRYTGPSHPC